MPKGIENGRHKLGLSDVQAIQKLIKQGIPGKDIAEQFGVHPSTIARIKRNKTWKEEIV